VARLNGIIFHSSQTGGAGRNLVLFNHACGVAPDDLPEGTEVTFLIRRADDDDDDDGDITVFESVPPDPPEDSSPTAPRNRVANLMEVFVSLPRWDEDEDEHDEPPTYGEATLRLVMESVVVLHIKGVHYDCHRRKVRRHRSTRGEGPDS